MGCGAGYPVTGAYVLDYCNENEKVVLTKNESFYDAENVTVDEITFQVMPDMDAQAAASRPAIWMRPWPSALHRFHL